MVSKRETDTLGFFRDVPINLSGWGDLPDIWLLWEALYAGDVWVT